MPGPVIVAFIVIVAINIAWAGFALGRPAIRDPRDRRAFEVDAEVEQ